MDFFGTNADDILEGQEGDDFLLGDGGNDSLIGNDGDDRLIGGNQNSTVGGRDTLEGGLGNDGYVVSFNNGGGSLVRDGGGIDAVLVLEENTNLASFTTPESFADPGLYGNAAIALSLPQSGIVGLDKSGNNLIVDLNRDGVAETENDLTIIDFFDDAGQLGVGGVELINNIVDPQDIINFFNNPQDADLNLKSNAIVGTDGDDVLEGTPGNDTIDGGGGNDSIASGAGNDLITGGTLGANFATVGGRDTLEGGAGDDLYGVSLTSGGGTIIRDIAGVDIVSIFAENTNASGLGDGSLDVADPTAYGDAAIALSLPQSGIVGLDKSGNNLIVDLNRDGVAETENDLTIVNFFDDAGQLSSSSVELINNIVDPQAIVDLFANSAEKSDKELVSDATETTVYRFFNNDTGVHFYTADAAEREFIEQAADFSFEGASYNGVDPLTGLSLPVYRFLNQDTGVHLYTVAENERRAVAELDNYSLEGEAFYAYATEMAGSIPIYRFFNPTTGAHFYTPSEAERDSVINNLPDFQSEGIAYYALPNIIENENLI